MSLSVTTTAGHVEHFAGDVQHTVDDHGRLHVFTSDPTTGNTTPAGAVTRSRTLASFNAATWDHVRHLAA